ncbi:MAG: adenylate/guanylate cyclase domain-containing protein [Sinobacteraceae bacterium]|nr:adenylate/guanylate cyclase domain-containing protein [Nevskiaceae bacterium]
MDSVPQRRLAAIMFTDIVGYSRLMGMDEARALRLLDAHDAILGGQVQAHGGDILKKMGDSVFAAFDSATSAVRCAIAIQASLAAHNQAAVPEERVAVRIGVHLGDVIVRHGDLFGDGINVAARLQPLAKPGGVCISNAVYQAVLKSVDPKPILVGEVELKNILERHVIYEFPPLYEAPLPEAAEDRPASRNVPVVGAQIDRVDDMPPPVSAAAHALKGLVLVMSALLVGVALSDWVESRSISLRTTFETLTQDGFVSLFLFVFFVASMVMAHFIRPISKRYVFHDIRGVDEWLEWAVMELGWCAPSKRGKALQFSPNFVTALIWGWMKLSVWVDGNAITVVGPAVFVQRLTRTVMATWSPATSSKRSA